MKHIKTYENYSSNENVFDQIGVNFETDFETEFNDENMIESEVINKISNNVKNRILKGEFDGDVEKYHCRWKVDIYNENIDEIEFYDDDDFKKYLNSKNENIFEKISDKISYGFTYGNNPSFKMYAIVTK